MEGVHKLTIMKVIGIFEVVLMIFEIAVLNHPMRSNTDVILQ